MEVEFLKKFEKDLTKVDALTRKRALRVVQSLETATSITELEQLKKLSGHQNTYRIRLGDYRLGIFVSGDKVQLARLLHRREVYRFFP